MKDNITILYIDDDIDYDISYYLKECLRSERYVIIEKEFKDNETIEEIINSTEVKSADIILIDSKLFEKENAERYFSGEEIKTIIRNVYPFKEVFVITQNDLDSDIQVIKKYNNQKNDTNNINEIASYYQKEIKDKISASVKNIDEYRHIIQLEHNIILKDEFDHLKRIIDGEIEYSSLKKEDVDKLVNEVKEINKILYGNK